MRENDFLSIFDDKNRKFIFVDDLNYRNLNDGYTFISSSMANSWLIAETKKAEKLLDFSKNEAILNYEDCLELGTDFISNLYQKGMLGISETEELFSDMFEFNIPGERCANLQ